MSDRKVAHYKKLKREYMQALTDVHATLGEKWKKYKEKIIADGCFHPETQVFEHSDDDGYGRWYAFEVTRCAVCRQELSRKTIK